jgi:hypothetical protein
MSLSEQRGPAAGGVGDGVQPDAGAVARDLAGSDKLPKPRGFRWRDTIGWLLVAAAVVVQLAMFRQFARREIVWCYPPNYDQLEFLDWSYLSALHMRQNFREGLAMAAGLRNRPVIAADPGVVEIPAPIGPRGLEEAPPPTEMMFTFQGALLSRVFGRSRLTLLMLNFFYFALFQCILVGTVRWATGQWSIALIALGLLLMAGAPFILAGGMFDFRMDFAALCLYGTFVCLVLRSGVFQSFRWSMVAAVAGALLFTMRFLTITYLAGTMGLTLLFLAFRWWRMRRIVPTESAPHPRRMASSQLRNAAIACLLILAVGIPAIVERFHALRDYYWVNHVTGPEKTIRALEQGVIDLKSNLMFYPTSLYQHQAGTDLFQVAGIALLAGILLAGVRWVMRRRTARDASEATRLDAPAACWFIVASFLTPLLVLTSDQSKSPVVGGILLGPLLLAIVIAIALLAGTNGEKRPHGSIRLGLIVIAIFVGWRGAAYAQARFAEHTGLIIYRPQIGKLDRLYGRMASAAVGMDWPAPSTGFDSSWDGMNYKAFEVLAFERQHQMLRPGEVLGNSIFARPPQEEQKLLQSADLTVLTESPPPPPGAFEYPADKALRELKPQFFDWCRRNCVQLDRVQFQPPVPITVTLFIRPAVKVHGRADGWIATEGTRITGLAEVLRARPDIVLTGRNAERDLPSPPRVTAVLNSQSLPPSPVPATLTYAGEQYRLELAIDPNKLPERGPIEITLSFEHGFGPGNELVMRLPDDGALSPLPAKRAVDQER